MQVSLSLHHHSQANSHKHHSYITKSFPHCGEVSCPLIGHNLLPACDAVANDRMRILNEWNYTLAKISSLIVAHNMQTKFFVCNNRTTCVIRTLFVLLKCKC